MFAMSVKAQNLTTKPKQLKSLTKSAHLPVLPIPPFMRGASAPFSFVEMQQGVLPNYTCVLLQTAEEPQEEEQTEFTVRLVSFADDSKIKLIKEVKTVMEGMNLVQVIHAQ